MALLEYLGSAEDRDLLTRASAGDFLHGVVGTTREPGGWVRPQRFTPGQMRVLTSCMAWHPGLFRQMARSTAGVCLRFRTDGSEVALSLRMDAEPRGTRAQLDHAEGVPHRGMHDGVSCDVNGRHLPVRFPVTLGKGFPGLRELAGTELVIFNLSDPGEGPDGMPPLPGFGALHEVTIWLPCLRGCSVGSVWTDGLTLEPVEQRPCLLVLGDSIAQGFTCDDPALSFPVRLAERLGMDVLNQGLYGQVFQQGSVTGLDELVSPARIVVEYGTNYRFEPCGVTRTERDVSLFLGEVSRAWPDVPTVVAEPLWHDEATFPTHAGSCFSEVNRMIARAVRPHGQMRVAKGTKLVDHDGAYFSDEDHPNAAGAAQMAGRLYVAFQTLFTSAEERRSRALQVLEGAPLRAFALAEEIRRGVAQVLFADEGCVLARVTDGNQVIYAPDHELGLAVLGSLSEPTLVTVCEPGLQRAVMDLMGFDVVDPYHLCVYQKDRPAKVAAKLAEGIRPLSVEFADQVREHYAFAQWLAAGELEALLAKGAFFGAFEGEGDSQELVGFVGEHPEGSIGMLEVFPGHRRRGWGRALEATKINACLELGQTPWTEVYPYNKASLKLQKSLGLTTNAATEQCFVSASHPGERGVDAEADARS